MVRHCVFQADCGKASRRVVYKKKKYCSEDIEFFISNGLVCEPKGIYVCLIPKPGSSGFPTDSYRIIDHHAVKHRKMRNEQQITAAAASGKEKEKKKVWLCTTSKNQWSQTSVSHAQKEG